MRITNQRKIILEELIKCSHHPGADEIYNLVRKSIPRISLGTVYRNLEFLAASGMIKKLDFGNGQKRFDGNIEPHDHFRCVNCNTIEDIPFTMDIMPLDENHMWVKKRIIYGMRLEIYGLCAACSAGK
ncbi:MAG: transcriptional repressor [Spirochaetales bacterium]|nr:transcriptional repressor [Spirochaetales bacterium]